MVNSQHILNTLTTVDTLLNLGGIIPSLSELQARLIDIMNNFTRALSDEGVTKADADALRRVACAWVDRTIETNLTRSWLTWKNYALESYFFDAPRDAAFYTALLASAMHSTHESVRACATSLVLLLCETRSSDAGLNELRAEIAVPAVNQSQQPLPEKPGVQIERLSPEPPPVTRVGVDCLIFMALLAALWRCCSHFLDAWYQCLF